MFIISVHKQCSVLMVNISVFTGQHLSCIYFDIHLKTQHVKATCNTTDTYIMFGILMVAELVLLLHILKCYLDL